MTSPTPLRISSKWRGKWGQAGVVAGCLLGGVLTGWGQPQDSNFYVRAQVGPNVTEDVDVNFTGALTGRTEAEFEVGGRLSLAGGYHVTEWMAIEGETGFFSNYLDRLRDADDVDVNDSRLTRVPFMGNVVFEIPNRSRFTPFAGVGVGVSFSTFQADDITDHETYVVDDTDTDAVLAYQGFVGMRFQINERMSLGLTYQYFASEEARWDLDTFLVQGDTRIKMDAQRTHAVTGVFKMTF